MLLLQYWRQLYQSRMPAAVFPDHPWSLFSFVVMPASGRRGFVHQPLAPANRFAAGSIRLSITCLFLLLLHPLLEDGQHVRTLRSEIPSGILFEPPLDVPRKADWQGLNVRFIHRMEPFCY